MDQILKFKGKRKDNNEWAYGFYVEFCAMTGEGYINGQITLDNQTKIHAIVDELGCVHEVVSKTVSQYWKIDKFGKNICVGDVIMFDYFSQPLEVKKDEDSIYVEFNNQKHMPQSAFIYVIGSIHDEK